VFFSTLCSRCRLEKMLKLIWLIKTVLTHILSIRPFCNVCPLKLLFEQSAYQDLISAIPKRDGLTKNLCQPFYLWDNARILSHQRGRRNKGVVMNPSSIWDDSHLPKSFRLLAFGQLCSSGVETLTTRHFNSDSEFRNHPQRECPSKSVSKGQVLAAYQIFPRGGVALLKSFWISARYLDLSCLRPAM
jgi:hypothetical protein